MYYKKIYSFVNSAFYIAFVVLSAGFSWITYICLSLPAISILTQCQPEIC